VQKGKFVVKKDEVGNAGFYLYRSFSIMALEPRRMQCAGYAIQIAKTKNAFRTGSKPLGIPKHGWRSFMMGDE
jgi:hypothetical protein